VANETKKWIEGKLIIFDDSFDHEVWNDGKEFRLVLIVDLWHPDLKDSTKKQLGPI
jgi:aspartate beta-hydroxylase